MKPAIAVIACLFVIGVAGCSGHTRAANYSSFDTPRLIARDVASEAGIARTSPRKARTACSTTTATGSWTSSCRSTMMGPGSYSEAGPTEPSSRRTSGRFPGRDRHGCATGDFNGDGRPDIYASIGACAGTCTAPKELWIQTADGSFVDRAAEFGITDPGGRGRQPITLNANGDGLAGSVHRTGARGRLPEPEPTVAQPGWDRVRQPAGPAHRGDRQPVRHRR